MVNSWGLVVQLNVFLTYSFVGLYYGRVLLSVHRTIVN